jgi:hypothetical protein
VVRYAAVRKGLALLAGIALLGAGSAACGNDSAEELERERELREERAEGAREERLRQLERRLRDQERQGPPPSGGGSAPPKPPVSGATSCGGGLSVGANTTCGFGENVREAYRSSGGDSTVTAHSPTTNQRYVMSCSSGSPHVCTGGNDATVYFP